MFQQNNTIRWEWLGSFLSHFSVNMVGDKSTYYNTEDLWESKGSVPHIHTVDASWSVMISFSTVREQQSPQQSYPVGRSLGGPNVFFYISYLLILY
jgi:hypothetical protein